MALGDDGICESVIETAQAADDAASLAAQPRRDRESRRWLDALRGEGTAREEAVGQLHAFLLRAARVELGRRASSSQLRGEELDDLAAEAADDALVSILAHLAEFRGASRFTTWACRFAILAASDALKKRMWKRRELPFDGDWSRLAPSATGPEEQLEQRELLQALHRAVEHVLSEQQRQVFVAVALNGVPIEVVAAQRGSTRGAVYKVLHDARRKLRTRLELNPSGAMSTPPARQH
jgi:RNA polymerase sigma-70 factor, ECF subfamily